MNRNYLWVQFPKWNCWVKGYMQLRDRGRERREGEREREREGERKRERENRISKKLE